MEKVKAKKHLGQHFLNNENIAQKIADSLTLVGYQTVLEIGPGMGVLTKYLLEKPITTFVIEIDTESVTYLQNHFPKLDGKIIAKDFLKYNLSEVFGTEPFAIIGNFPYNISTQIVFKTLELRHQIPEFSGMFQKEVAERIAAKPHSKAYGILSVLTQAFYEVEYLFDVPPSAFTPPPNVMSGVIRLKRKNTFPEFSSIKSFYHIVKMAFGQRRKMLRNPLKPYFTTEQLQDPIFTKRAENLTYQDFADLTFKMHNP